MPIDILWIEDDTKTQDYFHSAFSYNRNPRKWELIYVWDLDSFFNELERRPHIVHFILDWKFPKITWWPIDFCLPNALQAIQELRKNVGKIIISSWEDMDKLNGVIPAELGDKVIVMQKWTYSAYKVMDRMLEEEKNQS